MIAIVWGATSSLLGSLGNSTWVLLICHRKDIAAELEEMRQYNDILRFSLWL
jgi:hypothetical protein